MFRIHIHWLQMSFKAVLYCMVRHLVTSQLNDGIYLDMYPWICAFEKLLDLRYSVITAESMLPLASKAGLASNIYRPRQVSRSHQLFIVYAMYGVPQVSNGGHRPPSKSCTPYSALHIQATTIMILRPRCGGQAILPEVITRSCSPVCPWGCAEFRVPT